ncbi:hypothetical protein A9Q95_11055 [Rhodobacterales bacterium 59_46_T64]|nr:hypothetical protein A9Q95_11055 [Rhodobacterales bacterium 59_46_T64]
MSDTDSFIDEVTEEVRRDRLFAMMKRYGWIAVVIVLLIVGGAAYNEVSKARARSNAEALGDDILAALQNNDSALRAESLGAISAPNPESAAIVTLLRANELVASGDAEQAAEALNALTAQSDVPQIYRQIARFKALSAQDTTLDIAARRDGYAALAIPGGPLRLLAEERLALLDVEAGDTDAALERLEAILLDAETGNGLRRRATGLLIALGGDMPAAPVSLGASTADDTRLTGQ